MCFVFEYFLPFIIVLMILVFVHELGHYLVARFNDIKIDVFSIGFGPELFGWTDKSGTRWKFSVVPLGGYVKMAGDADASSRPDSKILLNLTEEELSRTLHAKTVGQRMAVSAAGPLANFLFALVVMTGLFVVKGQPFLPPIIGKVIPDKIAAKVGIQEGDKILSINGITVQDFYHLRQLIRDSVRESQRVDIERKDGQKISLSILPETTDDPSQSKKVGVWGVGPSVPEFVQKGLASAFVQSFVITYDMCRDTLISLGQMIIGKRSSEELGGILAIGDMASQSAKSGLASLFWFVAILSVNLGLINLLPVPVLDGGHLVFYGIEAIRGKPVQPKVQEYAFFIGMICVLGLMLLSTWNDLSRYKIVGWVLSFFK